MIPAGLYEILETQDALLPDTQPGDTITVHVITNAKPEPGITPISITVTRVSALNGLTAIVGVHAEHNTRLAVMCYADRLADMLGVRLRVLDPIP